MTTDTPKQTPDVTPTLADGVFPGRPAMPSPEGEDQTIESPPADSALGDTVGTGTAVALGCIGGTIFLIVISLLILLVARLIG